MRRSTNKRHRVIARRVEQSRERYLWRYAYGRGVRAL
jgi:hypothetical protein